MQDWIKKIQYRYNLTHAYFCGFMAKKYILLLEKTLKNFGIRYAIALAIGDIILVWYNICKDNNNNILDYFSSHQI